LHTPLTVDNRIQALVSASIAILMARLTAKDAGGDPRYVIFALFNT
jgi:hypothetical protein